MDDSRCPFQQKFFCNYMNYQGKTSDHVKNIITPPLLIHLLIPHYNEPFSSKSQEGVFILELKIIPSVYKVTDCIRTLKLERHTAHKIV